MEKINKTFGKIFMLTVAIYELLLGFRMYILDHTITPNETYTGLFGLMLLCTELILAEVKKIKKD